MTLSVVSTGAYSRRGDAAMAKQRDGDEEMILVRLRRQREVRVHEKRRDRRVQSEVSRPPADPRAPRQRRFR